MPTNAEAPITPRPGASVSTPGEEKEMSAEAPAVEAPVDPEVVGDDSHLIISDPRLPTDHFILEGVDVTREPVFTVSEVSKMFFARSPHWIRWRERKGFFVLDGEAVAGRRSSEGARRYNLADIEKMAHALAEGGAINGTQLTNALLLVQIEARLWGYL